MSKETFMLGFIAGVTSGGGAARKEPVAYLYNGVRLPKLPEWDKTAYPYVLITYQYGRYYVTIANVKQAANLVPGVDYWGSFTANGKFISYSLTDGDWVGGTTEHTANSGVLNGRYDEEGFVWANHDIYVQEWTSNSTPAIPTDTILLPASDPIPVYE